MIAGEDMCACVCASIIAGGSACENDTIILLVNVSVRAITGERGEGGMLARAGRNVAILLEKLRQRHVVLAIDVAEKWPNGPDVTRVRAAASKKNCARRGTCRQRARTSRAHTAE